MKLRTQLNMYETLAIDDNPGTHEPVSAQQPRRSAAVPTKWPTVETNAPNCQLQCYQDREFHDDVFVFIVCGICQVGTSYSHFSRPFSQQPTSTLAIIISLCPMMAVRRVTLGRPTAVSLIKNGGGARRETAQTFTPPAFVFNLIHGWGTTQRREWILDELRNRFCTIFATDSWHLALAIRYLHVWYKKILTYVTIM